jgi:hypothetical protein
MNVHGNNVQPSREAFFCALPANDSVVFVVFTMVKRPVGLGIPHRLQQLCGWNRSFGNWGGVCVVYDRNGSIDLQKTAF